MEPSSQNNNSPNKKNGVQELEDKFLAEQQRIYEKRQSLRRNHTRELQHQLKSEKERLQKKQQRLRQKRQHEQTQSMLEHHYTNHVNSSLLFADNDNTTVATLDTNGDSSLGPDYAASPLDGWMDTLMANAGGCFLTPQLASIVGANSLPAVKQPAEEEEEEDLQSLASRSIYGSDGTSSSIATVRAAAAEADHTNTPTSSSWWDILQSSNNLQRSTTNESDRPSILQDYLIQQSKKQAAQKHQQTIKIQQNHPDPVDAMSMTQSDTMKVTAYSYDADPYHNGNHFPTTTTTMSKRRSDESSAWDGISACNNSMIEDDDSITNSGVFEEEDDLEALTHRNAARDLVYSMSMVDPNVADEAATVEDSLQQPDPIFTTEKEPRNEKELAKRKALTRLRELSEKKKKQRQHKDDLKQQEQPKGPSMRCYVLITCLFVMTLCIVGIVVLTVDPFQSSTNANGSNTASTTIIDDYDVDTPILTNCGLLARRTNIIPECQCRTELPQPLSSEISFYRKLLLQYLVNAQIIPDQEENSNVDEGTALSQDDDITKLFTEGETSCNNYNQVLLYLTQTQGTNDDDNASASNTSNSSNDLMETVAQRFVLLLLYQSLGGKYWTRSDHWMSKTNRHVCDGWYGIRCSPYNDILQIDLSDNNLRGNLNTLTPLLGSALPELLHLNLSHNQGLRAWQALEGLSSSLPPKLQSLDVSHWGSAATVGSTSYTIPTELGRLTQLTALHLERGAWRGTIPSELGFLTQLEVLNLSYNQLEGTLPKELGDLTALQQFHVQSNQLTGDLPDGPFRSLTSLQVMDVSDNALKGRLPQSWKEWKELQTIRFQGNDWDSPLKLPDEPYGMNLQYISLIEEDRIIDEEVTVPEVYCTELLSLEVLRVGCPLDTNNEVVLPCPCCSC